VAVDYEELPAVAHADKALKPGAPQVHDNAPGNLIYDWGIGEEAATDAAIAGAAHVTEMHITNNRLSPNPMEPRSAVATFDESRTTTRSTPRARTRMWRGWC
jgi:aerobic carbon-monoxide dehydrogenase large subunit